MTWHKEPPHTAAKIEGIKNMAKSVSKFFKSISLVEWLIWSISVIALIASFIAFKNTQYLYLIGSLIGITALIFVSKGNPLGQVLTIVFSVFYGIISYSFRYYGEMITYLAMTAPIAVWALIAWLKNPYNGNRSEVRVNRISAREWCLFLSAGVIVTVASYFLLQFLNTANLVVSTVSVFTSFAASYLTARRSRFYAIAYGLNDIVLIVLWSAASAENLSYLPMVICFIAFFAADFYGFVNWTRLMKRQSAAPDSDKITAVSSSAKIADDKIDGSALSDNATDSAALAQDDNTAVNSFSTDKKR